MSAFDAGAGAAGLQDPQPTLRTVQGTNEGPVSPSQGCSQPEPGVAPPRVTKQRVVAWPGRAQAQGAESSQEGP